MAEELQNTLFTRPWLNTAMATSGILLRCIWAAIVAQAIGFADAGPDDAAKRSKTLHVTATLRFKFPPKVTARIIDEADPS